MGLIGRDLAMRDPGFRLLQVRASFATLWASLMTRLSRSMPEPDRTGTADDPIASRLRPWPCPLRILVADDNPAFLDDAREQLERLGVMSTLAADGAQAVALAKVDTFDLIFMDLQMPILDGLSATKLIRANESLRSSRRTPVVAYTSCALDPEVLMGCGVDGVLEKPCTARSIEECLSRWCTHRDDVVQTAPEGPAMRRSER